MTDAVSDALLQTLRTVRHDLHRHPELGFEEHRTQAAVRAWLEERGFAPRDVAETGLVVDTAPGTDGGIALRADLDALPMQEHTDLPYRSVHEGRAHKCGHDGHTAILLGVAAWLAENRDALAGNVRLLFQPAEEGVRGGGARVMVREGALRGIREVYGLHNWPGFEKGTVRVAAGPVMASVDTFVTELIGRGGHGAQPQVCRDPIVAGAAVVQALQTVVSRRVGSRGIAVVTVGAFQAGTVQNVIPERARLLGTIRTFDAALRDEVIAHVEQVIDDTARAYGVRAETEVAREYPVLVNAARCAEAVGEVAVDVVGADRVSPDGLPLAAAEDFAYFAQEVEAAYFFLGAGDPVGETPGCHHPDFDFDDDLLATGIAMFCGLVRARVGLRG